MVLRREEEFVLRQESGGDRGAGETKERNTKSEVVGNIKNDLSERELSVEEAKDRVQSRRLIRNMDPT